MKTSLCLTAAVAAVALVGFVLWKTARPPTPDHNPKTDVAPISPTASASMPLATEPAPDRVVSSDPRAAEITVGRVKRVSVPNTRGEFSRVVVPASAMIEIDAPFPGAEPGEALPVQAEDGGSLVAGVQGGAVTITEAGRARFAYQATPHDGLHRVTLRRGGESRVFEFWVGPEAPVLVRQ